MVTNYLQQFVGVRTLTDARERRSDRSVLERVLHRVGQFFCGVRGHDPVLHFEDRRMLLRCTSCGFDSPGWQLDARSPRLKYDGDVERHVLQPGDRVRLADRRDALEFAREKTA